MKQGKLHKPNNIHPLKTKKIMKQITITEDLYNMVITSTSKEELITQLKTEIFLYNQ